MYIYNICLGPHRILTNFKCSFVFNYRYNGRRHQYLLLHEVARMDLQSKVQWLWPKYLRWTGSIIANSFVTDWLGVEYTVGICICRRVL